MKPQRREVIERAYAAGQAHDHDLSDRLARFRNVEPETGALLGVLVRATRARRVLEIGTSNGYSTLWLADAVEAVSGRLESLEIDPERTRLAAEVLAEAELDSLVTLRTEDAAGALGGYESAAWDFVFLDAERPEYLNYYDDLLRVLAPGATLAVDNAISHAHELTEFSARLGADPGLTTALVPIGAGLLLSVLTG